MPAAGNNVSVQVDPAEWATQGQFVYIGGQSVDGVNLIYDYSVAQGNLLDDQDKIVPFDDNDKFGKAVHLQDIHLEKGMHCVDCHFSQDAHGNGKLYGETRNAVEIDCTDCHGQVNARAKLKTSGPARYMFISCSIVS